MSTFYGEYNTKIDGKGRIILPSPLKKEFDSVDQTVVIIQIDSFEKCLNLFSVDEWEKKVEKIYEKLDPDDRNQSKLLEQVFRNITKLTIADNGRMNFPEKMLKYANLKTKATFIGQRNRIRIWDQDELTKSLSEIENFGQSYEKNLTK
ncbi:MAG: hypothetical protein HN704_00040 [Bacteroidetes bacterium]|jgi:MraZ protein|nr:hypothetical protein [Bacteroidota bacterium]MBT6684744.1 hypothetical protein [Bacteroidota bacterium]MBT7143845.1 hypothetical protein [Bacteroidota bacterium]MBT7489974.1 hypothetical protein [Bacteroidota bacterium]